MEVRHLTYDWGVLLTVANSGYCSRLLRIKGSGNAAHKADCRGVCKAQDSLQLRLPRPSVHSPCSTCFSDLSNRTALCGKADD